jgi:DNA-binding HxlR family transcriptional regulator
MNLSEEERQLLYLTGKWHFLLGRHLNGFSKHSSKRTFYRRLKYLLDNGYLNREYLLYRVPPVYTLTHKGRILIGLNKRADKVRLEQLNHDIVVLDTVLYFVSLKNVSMDSITSEKELHSKDGFGTRKHYPDFIIEKSGETYAYEIELSLKSISRIEENVRLNYINYDYQVWVIEKENKKMRETIENVLSTYSGASIFYTCEVLKDD